jgi:hypothetical protein
MKKKLTSTTPISEVTIPVKDLRRLINDMAYDTIEIIAHRVRKMRDSERLDAQVSVSPERTTADWMKSAVNMALREIETSYTEIGKHIDKQVTDYKEWKTKR